MLEAARSRCCNNNDNNNNRREPASLIDARIASTRFYLKFTADSPVNYAHAKIISTTTTTTTTTTMGVEPKTAGLARGGVDGERESRPMTRRKYLAADGE